MTERLSPQKNNVLLSTKLHISDFKINKKISLIKILKNRGLRIDPWGIPLVTLAILHYIKSQFLSFVFENLSNQ